MPGIILCTPTLLKLSKLGLQTYERLGCRKAVAECRHYAGPEKPNIEHVPTILVTCMHQKLKWPTVMVYFKKSKGTSIILLSCRFYCSLSCTVAQQQGFPFLRQEIFLVGTLFVDRSGRVGSRDATRSCLYK